MRFLETYKEHPCFYIVLLHLLQYDISTALKFANSSMRSGDVFPQETRKIKMRYREGKNAEI